MSRAPRHDSDTEAISQRRAKVQEILSRYNLEPRAGEGLWADDYQRAANRTEAPAHLAVGRLLEGAITDTQVSSLATCLLSKVRMLHAAVGMATEGGEILTQLKAHLFYGKELDTENLVEECGDLLWYIALMLSACDTTMSKCMRANIAKLAQRYGELYNDDDALTRNTAAELDQLRGKLLQE